MTPWKNLIKGRADSENSKIIKPVKPAFCCVYYLLTISTQNVIISNYRFAHLKTILAAFLRKFRVFLKMQPISELYILTKEKA